MPCQFLTNRFKCDSFQTLMRIPAKLQTSPNRIRIFDKQKYQSAYKPGFVPMKLPSQCMAIHLEHLLPNASRNQPGQRAGKALKLAFRAAPIRSCSGWGLPCQSCCQACGALLPHRFTLTAARCGSLFSVALSLGSPPPGVTRHPIPVEPGLSSLAPFRA